MKVFAVETEGAASFAAAKKAGRVVTLDKISTVASSLGVLSVTPATLISSIKTVSVTVTDQEAVKACLQFAEDFKAKNLLVEPACGAALSLVSKDKLVTSGDDEIKLQGVVVVIVCGGSAVS